MTVKKPTLRHYATVSRAHVPRAVTKPAYMAIRRRIDRVAGPVASEEESPFSMGELRAAIKGTEKGKAAGADGVQPDLIKHLPAIGQQALLGLLNRSWQRGFVPSVWKTAIIVPILKKNKRADEKSYCPVSLLPCTTKLLERLVMARLQAWQAHTGVIPSEQAKFVPG